MIRGAIMVDVLVVLETDRARGEQPSAAPNRLPTADSHQNPSTFPGAFNETDVSKPLTLSLIVSFRFASFVVVLCQTTFADHDHAAQSSLRQ